MDSQLSQHLFSLRIGIFITCLIVRTVNDSVNIPAIIYVVDILSSWEMMVQLLRPPASPRVTVQANR